MGTQLDAAVVHSRSIICHAQPTHLAPLVVQSQIVVARPLWRAAAHCDLADQWIASIPAGCGPAGDPRLERLRVRAGYARSGIPAHRRRRRAGGEPTGPNWHPPRQTLPRVGREEDLGGRCSGRRWPIRAGRYRTTNIAKRQRGRRRRPGGASRLQARNDRADCSSSVLLICPAAGQAGRVGGQQLSLYPSRLVRKRRHNCRGNAWNLQF